MSAPPLPEVFGNYALKDFAEVVPPDSISWLPQTAGWLWLAVAALSFAAYNAWRALKHWYRNRYRREAIARLQALAGTSEPADRVADINRILKITALVAYSRERVAKLSGESWVNFLNQQCEQPPFNREHRELLANSVYRCQESGQPQQLMQASLQWIEMHRIVSDDEANHA